MNKNIKLKWLLSPLGLSVPSVKINYISCRFRLVLLPLHCLTPQILMSSMVWLTEFKCSATGSPGDRLRMLRRCSLKRSRRCLPVSPMYMLVQRRQVMQHTTFSDWQVKQLWMACELLGPCRTVWQSNVLAFPTAGTTAGKRAIKGPHWAASRVVLGNPGDSCRAEMRRGATQGVYHVSQDQMTRCWNFPKGSFSLQLYMFVHSTWTRFCSYSEKERTTYSWILVIVSSTYRYHIIGGVGAVSNARGVARIFPEYAQFANPPPPHPSPHFFSAAFIKFTFHHYGEVTFQA